MPRSQNQEQAYAIAHAFVIRGFDRRLENQCADIYREETQIWLSGKETTNLIIISFKSYRISNK